MPGYHDDDCSRPLGYHDAGDFKFSGELRRIVADHHELEAYENIIKTEYENKEKLFEMRLEQELAARMTSLADRTAFDLATEQAAFQLRLDQKSLPPVASSSRPASQLANWF